MPIRLYIEHFLQLQLQELAQFRLIEREPTILLDDRLDNCLGCQIRARSFALLNRLRQLRYRHPLEQEMVLRKR